MKWLSIQAYARSLRAAGFTILSLIGLLTAVGAHAGADTIVHGFSSADSLQPGWIVALSSKSSETVELTPANSPERIYGVVIDPSQAPATLQNQRSQKVFVATSGTYPVLVNTQHGDIHAGDYISISKVNGIGAKGTSEQSYVLGQSLESFDGQKGVISGSGDSAIGRVAVTITPMRNPQAKNSAAVPDSLRRVAESLGAQNLSPLRIYAALVIFLATAVIAASVLLVGVRSGMVSIGRNPLSRHYIVQGLLQVIGVAIGVFIIGVFAVYLLLKL